MPAVDAISTDPSVIAGIGGTVIGYLAYRLNKRGQKSSEQQGQAARALSELDAALDQKDKAIAYERQRADDAHADAGRERASGERWLAMYLEEQARRNGAEHRNDELREAVGLLARVVRDETAITAALDGVDPRDLPDAPDVT